MHLSTIILLPTEQVAQGVFKSFYIVISSEVFKISQTGSSKYNESNYGQSGGGFPSFVSHLTSASILTTLSFLKKGRIVEMNLSRFPRFLFF